MGDRTKDEKSTGTPCQNTDRHLWPQVSEPGAPHESLHIAKDGALGINCGGYVYVKPIREWHRLAGGPFPAVPDASTSSNERLLEALRFYANPESYDPGGGGGLPQVNQDRGKMAREALRQPVETSRDETGWLIEVELGGRPHYWKASADARCIGEFDPDADTALRLSREKDAKDLALFLSAKGTIALSDVRKIKITEHMWPCSPVEPKAQCAYIGAPQGTPQGCTLSAGHSGPHSHGVKATGHLSVQRAIGACKHDFGPDPDPDGTRCLKGCGAVYQQ